MNQIICRMLSLFTVSFAAVLYAADPSGAWAFQAQGPNGQPLASSVALQWNGDRLTGSVKNRAGETTIQDATFVDDQISFTVRRKVRFRTVDIRYTGQLDGDTITGTITARGKKQDREFTVPWSAQRVQ